MVLSTGKQHKTFRAEEIQKYHIRFLKKKYILFVMKSDCHEYNGGEKQHAMSNSL